MTKNDGLWKRRRDAKGVDETTFAEFERRYGVSLPERLKALYRIQNGGILRDVEDVEKFAPLNFHLEPHQRICPFSDWITGDPVRDADFLEYAEEFESEYGAVNKIVLVAMAYSGWFALNYNAIDENGEPPVIFLQFAVTMSESEPRNVAPSFSVWIDELTLGNAECAVDWEEHRNYPTLFAETIEADYPDVGRMQVEHILCRDGEHGILLLTRTTVKNRIKELERVSIRDGVDENWLEVREFRPKPVGTYTLMLQPADQGDIHWLTSKLKQNSAWKNEKSSGVPVSCCIESKNQNALLELADVLRKAGIARKRSEPEIPEELKEHVEMMMNWAENAMEQYKRRYETQSPNDPASGPQ